MQEKGPQMDIRFLMDREQTALFSARIYPKTPPFS